MCREEPSVKRVSLALGVTYVPRSLFWTCGLFSSRRASEATHFALPDSIFCIFSAVDTAALLSLRLRFPICLNDQLTAFLTEFLLSPAPSIIIGRKSRKTWSFAFLSWTASSAINTNTALFSNSASRLHHSLALATANGVLSKRFPQQPSTTSHESKSRTHFSIWGIVTCRGSSIMVARSLASCNPVPHNC